MVQLQCKHTAPTARNPSLVSVASFKEEKTKAEGALQMLVGLRKAPSFFILLSNRKEGQESGESSEASFSPSQDGADLASWLPSRPDYCGGVWNDEAGLLRRFFSPFALFLEAEAAGKVHAYPSSPEDGEEGAAALSEDEDADEGAAAVDENAAAMSEDGDADEDENENEKEDADEGAAEQESSRQPGRGTKRRRSSRLEAQTKRLPSATKQRKKDE